MYPTGSAEVWKRWEAQGESVWAALNRLQSQVIGSAT